jgi:hydrogenase maturation protease
MRPSASAPRTLVIGYGNTLRGDDGIGPWVAKAIADNCWQGVVALAVQQLTPELVEHLAQAHTVVFIDACVDARSRTVELAPLVAGDNPALHTHVADPQRLLCLAHTLYANAPVAWMVRVAGADFGLRETLSPQGQACAAEALRLMERLLQSIISGPFSIQAR